MQIKQFRLSYIVVIILIGVLVFGLGFTSYRRRVPIRVYQVYIDGEKILKLADEEKIEKGEVVMLWGSFGMVHIASLVLGAALIVVGVWQVTRRGS